MVFLTLQIFNISNGEFKSKAGKFGKVRQHQIGLGDLTA
jgi:hypothetical protein